MTGTPIKSKITVICIRILRCFAKSTANGCFFFSGVPQKEVSTMEHNKTIFERLGITYTQGEERARRSSEMEN